MRRVRTTVGALVAGVAVAVSPLGVAQPADASRVDLVDGAVRATLALPAQIAALPDSAGLAAPVVLQGALAARGVSLAGADVLLSAWPSNETAGAMPNDGAFVTVPIARAVADARGGYVLRGALTPTLAALVGRDGLDVQLDVVHGDRKYTYLSQVVPGGALGWLRTSVSDVRDLASLVAGAPQNALDIAFSGTGEAIPVAAARDWPQGPEGPGSDAGPRPWPGGPPCLERKVATKKAWTTIASAVAQRGSTANVTYMRGAETEMDAQVSYDGPIWVAEGGKRTRSSTFTAPFDPQSGTRRAPANREFKVVMAHAVFAHECAGNKPDEFRVRGYRISPVGTTGGFGDFPSSYPVWTCTGAYRIDWVDSNAVETTQARAFTYVRGFGFNFKGASVGGASTSGYSDTVQVKFTYAKRTNGKRNWWCGHTAYPAADGQRVQGFQR